MTLMFRTNRSNVLRSGLGSFYIRAGAADTSRQMGQCGSSGRRSRHSSRNELQLSEEPQSSAQAAFLVFVVGNRGQFTNLFSTFALNPAVECALRGISLGRHQP